MDSNSRIQKSLEANSNIRSNTNGDIASGLINLLLNNSSATINANTLTRNASDLGISISSNRNGTVEGTTRHTGGGTGIEGTTRQTGGTGSGGSTRQTGGTGQTRSTGGVGGTRPSGGTRGPSGSPIDGRLNKNISMFDANKDGVLSLDEVFNYFITMKARVQQPSPLIFQASPQAKDISDAITAFDMHNNQTLTDSELVQSLLKLRGGEFNQIIDPSIAKFVLSKFNNNRAGLESAIALIDNRADKVISDLEVLNTLMSSRQGTININEPNINTVLRTNANFERLLAAFQRLGNGSGNLNDQEAFQIILDLRQANVSDATLDRALFLGFNAHAEEITHSVQLFDSQADGQITDSEFISTIMQMRKGELSTTENQLVLNILNNIPRYKNIKDVIVALDTSANGQISDDELIDFTLGNLRGHITVDEALVNSISASNDKTSIIKSLINKTDADHSGTITNQEYLTAITDLENHNLSSSAQEVLNKILARNPNHQAIETALSFIDQDQDSIISDTEVSRAILAKYKGETAAIDTGIFNMILASNTHKASIESIINSINPAKDGNINPVTILNSVTDFKQGRFVADEAMYRAVLNSIPKGKETIDTFEIIDANHNNTLDLREYTQALMNINKGLSADPGDEILTAFTAKIANAAIVKQAIAIIDADLNGTVSALEFTGNFIRAIAGSNGATDPAKLAILSPLMDIIYPGAAALDQFRRDVDINNNNIITDQELIDGLLKLNNHSISNPGAEIVNVVLSANPNKSKIISLVSSIDQDQDGSISNIELTNNLMKVRKGGFATEDIGIVQAILHKNSSFNNVQSVINIFDPDQNGLITDIEMFVGLMAQQRNNSGTVFIPEVVNALKSMNPNTAAIQALINNIDPDNNGKIDYDELVSTYLKINAGTMQDVSAEIKRVLPAANGVAYGALAITAETLVDTIDADHNGQVSNLEIANIIIANKKNNILSTYAPELVAAIYRTNPNKTTIEALINQIGGADGNFTDAEVASAILAQRLNPNIYGANAALVEAILSAQNSSYSHIKNLISSIDGDNNGTISNLEAMKSVVKDAKGLIPAADKPLVDSIISSNTNLSAIKTAYNGFSINPNSATLTQDLFGKWIEIQQGVRTGTYFDDTVEALGKTSELNALKTQFTALDIDGNGRINDTEFGSLLVDIAKGVKSLSSYQTMINYLVKDPALLAVKNTIDSFGNRSDDGMLRGLLGLWNPTNKALLNKTYVQSILALNPDSAAIQKILTLVDPQKTGVITNGSTVGYITSLQIARYSSPQIDVAKYDFNGNNSIDQSDFETYNAFYQYITNSNGGVPFKVY